MSGIDDFLWDVAWTDPGARPYLEALGWLAIQYNDLEETLQTLIRAYLAPLTHTMQEQILGAMTNAERSGLLRTAAAAEPLPPLGDRLLHFLRAFSICTENRNIVLHARAYSHEKGVILRKRRADPPYHSTGYDVKLPELEALVGSTGLFVEFGRELDLFMFFREPTMVIPDNMARVGPIALPEKPDLPRKLIPRPRASAL